MAASVPGANRGPTIPGASLQALVTALKPPKGGALGAGGPTTTPGAIQPRRNGLGVYMVEEGIRSYTRCQPELRKDSAPVGELPD